MNDLEWSNFVIYLMLLVSVLLMNAAPGLMPATWTVLAFFLIKFNLALLPTVILGALGATTGRVILANLSRKFGRPMLPSKSRNNLTALGTFLVKNKRLSIPLVISYAFLPIPSNQVFIALGLSGLDFNLVAGSFFVGRLISYSFWVKMADKMTDNLGVLIGGGWNNPRNLVIEGLGILAIIVLMVIPWPRILKIKVEEA